MVPIERLSKQLCVIALLAASAAAQVQVTDPTRALAIPGIDPDTYVVRAMDALSVEVKGLDFKLVCFVLADGTITMPAFVAQTSGRTIKAQGVTLAQLQTLLGEKSKGRVVHVALLRHGRPFIPPVPPR